MNDPAKTPSVSIIITAMNEEGNLRPTVESVLSALGGRSWDYEIVIVDDGSTDRTGAIADDLAASDPRIRVDHHLTNLGLDHAYRRGIELAGKGYIAWVAGNNLIPAKGLRDLYDRIGDADLILSYHPVDYRSLGRRLLSRGFTLVLNFLFGLRLRYYNGPCVMRAAAAKTLKAVCRGSMIMPEIPLRLVKKGETYVEVAIVPNRRTSGRTKTFRLSNVGNVGASALRLFVDVQLLRRSGHE